MKDVNRVSRDNNPPGCIVFLSWVAVIIFFIMVALWYLVAGETTGYRRY